MRQWCADRYEHYPVTPNDMNSYHENYIDGDKSCALTMCDGDEIFGYIKEMFDSRLKKLIETSQRGEMIGDWHDYGRLLKY